jgi:hypothetical protein
MGDQTILPASLEVQSEQEMLLQALAERGLDPELALEVVMEPLWMGAGPDVPDTSAQTAAQLAASPPCPVEVDSPANPSLTAR